MHYTTSDMAKFIKDVIPSKIPESYSIKPMFLDISDEEDIRNGVVAFRDLLYLICDTLIDEGSLYDKKSKGKQTCDFHPSLSSSFPFINNIKCILFNIGYHGKLIDSGKAIVMDDINILTTIVNQEGRQLSSNISNAMLTKALKFLTQCGFDIDGIDLSGKRIDMSEVTTIKVTYTDKTAVIMGMKVMAIAQRDLNSKGNHNIFLRCDYRALKREEADNMLLLKDFVDHLPEAVQEFALAQHKCHLDAGLKCRVDVFYLSFRFIYTYKGKEIYTLSASLHSGYRIIINALNSGLYKDVIQTFPSLMQDKISRGFGCSKRVFDEPCQIECHGYSFPLDDSIVDISQDIELWIDKEISTYIKKKK